MGHARFKYGLLPELPHKRLHIRAHVCHSAFSEVPEPELPPSDDTPDTDPLSAWPPLYRSLLSVRRMVLGHKWITKLSAGWVKDRKCGLWSSL